MSLLLCLHPKKGKSAGKKLKEKGAQDILELAAPITKYVPTTRTEVLYQSGAPRHDSLSPTASAADSGDYNRSQRSNDSGKSSGYASGYMTDDSMTAEGQLLRRATQTNPASVIMTIVKDYKACCGEEMTVKKGQRVKVMYRQGDWAYAMSKHGGKGFIPYSFVRASRKYPGSGYTSEPDGPSRRHLSGYETDPGITTRTRQRLNSASTITSMQCRSMSRKDIRYTSPIARNYIREETPSGYMSECVFSSSGHAQRQSRSTRPPPTTYFRRNFIEKLVVLHDFTATDEDEVVVTKGEEVRVLNADDASWLWVQTMHGREGYVPRNCLPFGTHPALQKMTEPTSTRVPMHRPDRLPRQQLPHHLRSQSASRAQREFAKQQFRQLALAQHNPAKMAQTKEEIKRIGTRLLVLANYEPLQSDELRVELGEMVLADVLTQNNVKRVWAYCPRLDQVGYLPVWVVHPPML